MFGKLWKIFKISIVLVVVAGIVFGIYLFVVANAVSLDVTKLKTEEATMKIYDKYGDEIELYGYGNSVKYEELPKNLINAFVCIEDKNFFSHNGYDAWRIIKATVKNLISLSPTKEGASTITQQLIKNTQLSSEKTIERKVQELKLAIELEGLYTKEEILTSYLNVIYFGNSIYGINNAAQKIFGKNCKDLTLSECATLAGIVKNPSRYSPLRNYEKSVERRDFILSEMQKDGFITSEEMNVAKNQDLQLSEYVKYGDSFVSAVIDEAVSILGIDENELAYGGYKIKTSYDKNLQEQMEVYFKAEENLAKTKNGGVSDALALVCDNASGLISAYYSSYRGNVNELRRQPGSLMKPFISYLPQISAGDLYPSSPVCDERRDYDGYSPENYSGKYIGWTSARTALEKSINTIAVENCNKFGVASCVAYAEKYGFRFDEKDYALSVALGGMTYGVTPIEILSAYATIARGGCYKKSCFIEYIGDNSGKNIYNFSDISFLQVETPANSYLMSDMLRGCVERGTAVRMYTDKYDISAKTGTVGNAYNKNYNNDIWNASFTSKNTVCVWMGNLSNAEDTALLNDSLAGIYPTEGAKKIYDVLCEVDVPQDILRPDGVVELSFSKEKYDGEHVLILAGEFYTSDIVYKDIFNIENLELEFDQGVTDVNLDSFRVTLRQSKPVIEFETVKGVEYIIKKSSLTGSEDTVESFIGNGEKYVLVDQAVLDGCDYEYRVEAYVKNHLGKRVYLGSSRGFLVTVPYNFWDFD